MELRVLREGDRAEFIRVMELSEALHRPWMPLRPAGATFDALFARQLLAMEQGLAWKGVLVLDDGRIAGCFNLNEIVRGPFQCAYAGWSINSEVAGRGLATVGVRRLLDVAFGGLGLHRVQANIIPRNAASVRVAEKVGFRLEGRALRYLQIAGVWEDHDMYALTAEEWGG
jgi:[ribosomal protein S5]-alanine N-acetyltransferase